MCLGGSFPNLYFSQTFRFHQLENKYIKTKYEVRVGAAADQIIDLADTQVFDMVAMSTQGQNAIGLWPLGSVAQKVMLGGNTPLLLIRA